MNSRICAAALALSFAFSAGANSRADDSPRNLALTAKAASPHPPLRGPRTADKAVDGVVGDNADRGWTPAVAVSPEHPALLALTWPQPVSIRKVTLRYLEGKTWHFVDYTLARWEGAGVPDLGAPETSFPHQDIFIGGEGGYHTYRIPALVTSKRGTLLAFCEGRRENARDWGTIDMLLRRSTDSGRTWGPVQTLHAESGRVTIGNPFPIVDRETGEIHLIYARDGRALLYRVSKDDGATFSEPVDITSVVRTMTKAADIDWNHVLPGPGHGLQCVDGRLIVQIKTAGHKRGGPDRRVGAIYSDDHGRTWQPGGWIPPTKGETSESTLFQMGDGTVVINTRWHDGPHRVVSRSRDRGLTWSAPEPDPQLPDPACEGAILRASDKPEQRRVYFSNIVPEPSSSQILTGRRSRLVVRASEDDGATWPLARVIVPGPAGYSDLTMAPDGNLLVLFENGRTTYSDKLTLAFLAPEIWNAELARSRAELTRERYDFAQAKAVIASPAWTPIVTVRDAKATGSTEHSFAEPIVTQTLLLAITKVDQPDAAAYLQEIEVWGDSAKTPSP